ncbi:hypothetical protein LINPERPRIM_LOCUS33159 [Linum perenne]
MASPSAPGSLTGDRQVPPPSNPRSSNRRRLNPNREKQSLVQELGIQAVGSRKGA